MTWKAGAGLRCVLQGAHNSLCSGSASSLLVSLSYTHVCVDACIPLGMSSSICEYVVEVMGMCVCVCVAGDVYVCVHVCMCPGQSGRPSCKSLAALLFRTKIAPSDLGQEVRPVLLLLVTGEVI